MKKVLLFSLLAVLIVIFSAKSISSRKAAQTTRTVTTKQVVSVATPKEIIIPKIKVNTTFEFVGMDYQGRMDVPKNPANVAWYDLGPKPGEMGSAVIAGHLDDVTGAPAVFWELDKLKIGDTIKVVDANSKERTFKVSRVTSYAYQTFPLQKVFADASGKYLNLITCSGTWDKEKKSYTTRTVVYSKLE